MNIGNVEQMSLSWAELLDTWRRPQAKIRAHALPDRIALGTEASEIRFYTEGPPVIY